MITTTTSHSDPAAAQGSDTGIDIVTGAFSYSGRAIAEELMAAGRTVRTLTGHAARAGGALAGIGTAPLCFDDPVRLAAQMEGATTLYNTYWVRFAHGGTTHESAVANSRTLFHAARRAGLERIVHVSITHPSAESPYAYFRGKAFVEQALAEAGLSFAIVRPAILFGRGGVLVNNIAWLLRKLPVFAVAGDGTYSLRPVHVDDLARLCVTMGKVRSDQLVDAVGPESLSFDALVRKLRDAVGSRAHILHVPPAIVPPLSAVLGRLLHDVLLTGEELRAMMGGLADTIGPATGEVAFSTWLADQGDALGRHYANELTLHF
jgi:nucleoside-diphosphate-sugar epimerase